MAETSVIATLSAPPSTNGVELSTLRDSVQWLEVRTDLTGELDPDWLLRHHFRGRIIYSFRDDCVDRHERLAAAAERTDRVELQADRDFTSELLELVPQEKRP